MNALEKPTQFKPDDFIMEAAPGIARSDVNAIDRGATGGSYATRTKIHPKLAHGKFRTAKWVIMAITLGIYYLLPWLRWDRGDSLPSQAFLIDFSNQRLLIGPLQIWAQEFYYVTGLLIIAAFALFLVTSVAGRVWCGYTCPQTVWTDLMVAVERFWQGDRNAQIRLDSQPWTFEKIWKKSITHLSWLVIALLTGGALVFYFCDAPTLAHELLTGEASTVVYTFVGIFTLTTYLLGGIAREQVCIYMCPWPRIQGAMLDRDSLLVAYRDVRGEPRGPHKRGQTWDDRGDCIDCKACVAVCPMGIDIRNGPQLECIQCALCIDACNEIMEKVERPRGLIAYSTERNQHTATTGPRDGLRIVRPRTILYSVLIAAVGGLMLWGLLSRSDLDLSVEPDRNPLFVKLSDGGVRNGYTIKIVNKAQATRRFELGIDGLPTARFTIAGFDGPDAVIAVEPSNLRALKLFVTLPPETVRSMLSSPLPLKVTVKDLDHDTHTVRETSFHGPAP